MRTLDDEMCENLARAYGLTATPELFMALRRAYQFGLNTDVMKTRDKNESPNRN